MNGWIVCYILRIRDSQGKNIDTDHYEVFIDDGEDSTWRATKRFNVLCKGGKDKEFEEKMSELISRRNKLIREKGGVMKKFYLAEIIYDWAHLKGEDDDELSNDEGKIYLRDHARDVTDPKDRTLFQTEFEDALDIDNYSFDLKYLAKTTIMIPARSLQMIHQADGSSSYTDKHDLDISQLNSTNSTERSIIENLNTIMNKQQQELKSAADKQQQQ